MLRRKWRSNSQGAPSAANSPRSSPPACSSSVAASTFRLLNWSPCAPGSLRSLVTVSAMHSPELTRVKERQRNLTASRTRRLAELHEEADSVRTGDVEFLLHALIVPADDSKEMERYDAEVDAAAVRVATAYEEGSGAEVKDVSRPAQARQAGLSDWPGFDLLSIRAAGERRCIEVKGRAGRGSVEVSDNEWAKACNLRDEYWLYVVYDCATPRPRLLRVRDPFAKLLVGSRKLPRAHRDTKCCPGGGRVNQEEK